MIRYLALLLCLLGCGLLGKGGWIEAKAWLAEGLIASAWQQTLAGQGAVPPWPWADTQPVAKLESPRLGVERWVLSGDSGRTLAFGPGWSEYTTAPGEEGRSFISGHRDTHFHFLKDLQVGDRLIIQKPDGNRVDYQVAEIGVINQGEGWRLPIDGPQELLLITCYPFDALTPGATQRYIVRAELKAQ
ncbi:MAG: class GN sortase [Candidatus Thiodiazotropha sp.]|jgi:sortase A